MQINKTIHPSVAELFSQFYEIQICTEFTRWRNHEDVKICVHSMHYQEMILSDVGNVVIKEICASLKIRYFNYVDKKIIVSELVVQWLHQLSQMKKFLMED